MTEVAWYIRVSTEDQELERQMNILEENAPPANQLYKEKITGTNTDRKQLQKMLSRLDEIDEVYCTSLSRMSRSVKDLNILVQDFEESGTVLDFIKEPITIQPDVDDPMQNFMVNIIGAMAQFEADITRQRTKDGIRTLQANKDDYHHGRPPLGFDNVNAELVPADNYNTVCSVLDLVHRGEMSKRKASKQLDCARATISTAIQDRPELYDLD